MKQIKNILFCAGISLLGCLSCSGNDDSEHLNGIDAAADAKLTVGIKATGAKTKAYNPNDLNELEGEARINNLAVLIFGEDGSVMGKKWEAVQAEYTATLTNVPAKAAKARIVIVANISEGVVDGVTSYDGFQESLAELSVQSQTDLTMSSRVITTTNALIAGDNYLGYEAMGSENVNGLSAPIYLTRIASRVDLVSLDTKFDGTPLAGRSVNVEAVSIGNMKTQSRYFSAAEWGAIEVNGNRADAPMVALNSTINDGASVTNTPYSNYVMENTEVDSPTQIVVRASLLASADAQAQTKTFTSTINLNGIAQGYNHNLIKRNYVYRLRITFGANSFEHIPNPEDPDEPIEPEEPQDGYLNVAVEVVGWGPVSQNVGIE